MDRFPPELLHKVFIHLDLKERLICTLVCHNWWSVLDTCSLLYDVKITNTRGFRRFMDMIKQSPHREAQVEELTVSCCFKDGLDKRNFCNMFPDVRIIDMKSEWEYDCDCSSHFSKAVETAQTTSKVRHIADSALCEYASQMMTSNLCGQLRLLDLDFKSLRVSWQTILPQMKNVPVLEELVLITPSISITDVELLHNNMPSIQSLKLNIMEIKDSEMPQVIKPTTQLTTIYFSMGQIDQLENHMKWYRYMTQKYASATSWYYCDVPLFMEQDKQFIYANGYIEFLALVAPTQAVLSLDEIPENINIFEALDSRDCRIAALSLYDCQKQAAFRNLVQSKLSQYIETLTIGSIELCSYGDFQKFTALTKLELCSISHVDSDLLDLNDCLNSLPDTLTDLEVQSDYLEARPINCKVNSIERLSLHTKYITSNVVNTALTCFPKLVGLLFSGEMNSNLNVVLHSPSLRSVQFSSDIKAFSYKCPTQPKPLYYSFENGEEACVRYEDVKTRPILSVESFTKRTWEFEFESIAIVQDD